MKRPFGLTISLSIVFALFFAVVCEGQVLLAETEADINFIATGDFPEPFCPSVAGVPLDGTFNVTLLGGPFPGDYPGWCLQFGVPTPDGNGLDVKLYSDPLIVTEIINYLLNNMGNYLGQTHRRRCRPCLHVAYPVAHMESGRLGVISNASDSD